MSSRGAFGQGLTVARFTFKEALGNRLAWAILIVVALGRGLGAFVGEISLTETTSGQALLVGEFYRLAAVFLLSTFVIASLVREFNDKVLDVLLALDLTRTTWLLGKALGFAGVALSLAGALSLAMVDWVPWFQLSVWGLSLAYELFILAGLGMLCVLTFTHLVGAMGAVLAFYVLARGLAAMQVMAHSPLTSELAGRSVIQPFIAAISTVLPRLDLFARGEWLAYHTAGLGDLFVVVADGSVFLFLVVAAALFDFHRKNL